MLLKNDIILLSQAILMTFSPFNYGSTALWQYKVTQALFILLHMLEIMAFFFKGSIIALAPCLLV